MMVRTIRTKLHGYAALLCLPLLAAAGCYYAAQHGNYHSSDPQKLLRCGVEITSAVKKNTNERPMLVPCGTPFGIKILTDGVIAADFGSVECSEGNVCPARECGLKRGDVIRSINGMEITRNDDITEALQRSPAASVTVLRGGREKQLRIEAKKSLSDGLYKIGLWVKDSSAGIGTLTYYNPADGSFGGLGHAVCDSDTGLSLPISQGEAAAVSITAVKKGINGAPGELSGSFMSKTAIGVITRNCSCGVFGTMSYAPSVAEPIPLAYASEVETGSATILTTLSGMTPAEYDIEIEKISGTDGERNMVIRVTDPQLISLAGGIVQGMSGSPIIQNGRLAGAVTHVFVNDTKRGYAIFAENMLDNADNAAESYAA